ncbi:MAG: DUF2017 domain-containing protein [Propionibacteriaceae bacterium]|nr:DUF2017 domain-containing protein [Propionibacteriaceae bacterium]
MKAFRRRGKTFLARLTQNEAAVLGTLAGELAELVQPLRNQDGEWLPDPAISRLFPDAYRGDADASEEFRHFTQADQASAKAEAAQIVIADLLDADDGWVTVTPGHVDAWLTTLTNLRLVLATRLDADPRAATAAVLDWCGWIQQSLLETVAAA